MDTSLGLVQRRLLLLFLAIFYGIIDVYKIKKWSFPLIVIGANPIAAYLIAHTMPSFLAGTFSIHFGENYSKILGDRYSSLVSGGLILLIEFLILY